MVIFPYLGRWWALLGHGRQLPWPGPNADISVIYLASR